ncbi:MAG: hypothetical protein ACRCZD_08220 [Phycicoccus sp.]
MTGQTTPDALDWSGTSDGAAAIAARAALTPDQRWGWFEQGLALAHLTGVLAGDRAARQAAADAWATAAQPSVSTASRMLRPPPTSGCRPSGS